MLNAQRLCRTFDALHGTVMLFYVLAFPSNVILGFPY